MNTNKGGAPVGNQNAKNAHEWKTAMQHVLNTYAKGTIKKGLALRGIAEKLIDMALGGDIAAIREIGDRSEENLRKRLWVKMAGHYKQR